LKWRGCHERSLAAHIPGRVDPVAGGYSAPPGRAYLNVRCLPARRAGGRGARGAGQ
jgi:hypothetical protein